MNKKVLTLCAGVLLVSGSAVFTMNALNVGNEKAQSTYVAAISTRAAGDVVSYTLQTATYSNELTPNWALETATEEGQSYLKVGEFYLGTDLTMTSTWHTKAKSTPSYDIKRQIKQFPCKQYPLFAISDSAFYPSIL